jgi:hypothetical protein
VARLQSLHAKSIANREHRFDCGTYRGADLAPMPPILPVKREWRAAVLEAANGTESH